MVFPPKRYRKTGNIITEVDSIVNLVFIFVGDFANVYVFTLIFSTIFSFVGAGEDSLQILGKNQQKTKNVGRVSDLSCGSRSYHMQLHLIFFESCSGYRVKDTTISGSL